jgi:Arc/MetJ family transcription regulator
VIFKRVGDGRPYPDHELGPRDWASLPPRPVRLDELVTTKDTLQLAALLDEDSTFFGDLFAHVVEWGDDLYLEDGLHRALRAALQQRNVIHVRVLDLDALTPVQASTGPATASIPAQPPVPNPRRI